MYFEAGKPVVNSDFDEGGRATCNLPAATSLKGLPRKDNMLSFLTNYRVLEADN